MAKQHTAPTRLRVKVTQEHIATGLRCHTGACPIAKAVSAKTSRGVCVGSFTALIGEDRWQLSARALAFRRAFDAGRPVKPCTIELRRVSP